jgi:hypothetical protein
MWLRFRIKIGGEETQTTESHVVMENKIILNIPLCV